MDFILNIDWKILYWIQDNARCAFLDFFMPVITKFGDGGIFWLLVTVALVCTKKYRRQGLVMAAALFMGLLIGNIIIKNIVRRPRPFSVDPSIVLLIKRPGEFSFPSAHSLIGFLAATVLSMINRKFAVIAFPLAFLIALSRLYLFVHFPSDVLCGAIIGITIGFLVYYFGNRIKTKNPKQADV